MNARQNGQMTPEPVAYAPEQQGLLARIESAVRVQLAPKPKRLAHSLSVAHCCEGLALTYGVDPFCARAAGLLHDWDKVVPAGELVSRARGLGIDMGVDLELVEPLLHGIVAARELPDVFPELPHEVWRAVEVHTTAAAAMSPLDQALFVADGIEPLRPATPGIQMVRELVGKVPLEEVFWTSFVGGITYVLEGGRYLYPGTIDTYNSLAAAKRNASRGPAKSA